MDLIRDPEENGRTGKALAALTNGLVHLLSQSYGRGPTKAKSYLLDDSYVVCVLEDTMTTVERILVERGHGDLVRQVRATFQQATADAFRAVAAEALGRRVIAYHSQMTLEPDRTFEFFILAD